MLSVFWSESGVVHREFLPKNKTVTAQYYRMQLDRLSVKLKSRTTPVVFHQDNARPHTAEESREKFAHLGYDLLPHPPYSPDLAPSDYHLFRSMQHHLKGRRFHNNEQLMSAVDEFFASKPASFYERGIYMMIG